MDADKTYWNDDVGKVPVDFHILYKGFPCKEKRDIYPKVFDLTFDDALHIAKSFSCLFFQTGSPVTQLSFFFYIQGTS